MGITEYLYNLFLFVFLSGFFFLSVLKFLDFYLLGKLDSLLLKIEQHKSIMKILKLHIKPEVVQPHIKKTLLKQLSEDNFSIVVDRTPHFPYKEVFLSYHDSFTYFVFIFL